MATYDQLTEWAGLGHVTRAGRDVVAGWRIPDSPKAQLAEVGIPVAPRLIERVVMQSEAEPTLMPDGEAWFANSSVGVWLDVLHHYGSRVTASELLSEPDGPEEYFSEEEEERAFAELHRLAEELKEIDPAAFSGDEGFLWPGLLDRWLY
ncbi:SUKH-4 family immunity protein [Streptomyces sp. NPDC048332]|uniref:SUKH-4 family immunity protein n=1 Tax=unclassified Streptomyces TaxID=2593676 RepID=UPI00343B9636